MIYNDVATGADVEGAQSVDEELCSIKGEMSSFIHTIIFLSFCSNSQLYIDNKHF